MPCIKNGDEANGTPFSDMRQDMTPGRTIIDYVEIYD